MNKEIITIIRKEYPKTVLMFRVGDLDLERCSNGFKKLVGNQLSVDSFVYVKCDVDGNIEYRGKKREYRLYDITKH